MNNPQIDKDRLMAEALQEQQEQEEHDRRMAEARRKKAEGLRRLGDVAQYYQFFKLGGKQSPDSVDPVTPTSSSSSSSGEPSSSSTSSAPPTSVPPTSVPPPTAPPIPAAPWQQGAPPPPGGPHAGAAQPATHRQAPTTPVAVRALNLRSLLDKADPDLVGDLHARLTKTAMAAEGNPAAADNTLDDIQKQLRQVFERQAVRDRQAKVGREIQRMASRLPQVSHEQEFEQGGAKAVGEEVDQGGFKGQGSFTDVVNAWSAVERHPGSLGHLVALEREAQKWLDASRSDVQKKEGVPNWETKKKHCQELIAKAGNLQTRLLIEQESEAVRRFAKPPWNPEQEAVANRLRSRLCIATKPPPPNLDRGQSESFCLQNADGENAFIFKPCDGEYLPPGGWKPGSSAAREVLASTFSDVIRTAGMNVRVSPATLVTLDHPSLASEQNGDHSRRTGAILDFVRIDKEGTARLQAGDPEFAAKLDRRELEGVLVFDMATLQCDRQANNLLVENDAAGEPHLVPIDAGLAMPPPKAFQMTQNMFGSNHLLRLLPQDQPFSPETKAAIARLNPDQIARDLQAAHERNVADHPELKKAVGRESIEMARRSIKFLKAVAADPDLTVGDLSDAYQTVFQKVLKAHPPLKSTSLNTADREKEDKQLDAAISQVVAETRHRALVFAWVKEREGMLQRLGWPVDRPEFTKADPFWLQEIISKSTPCPPAVKELKDLVARLGGAGGLPFAVDEKFPGDSLPKLRAAADAREADDLKADAKIQEAGNKIQIDVNSASVFTLRELRDFAMWGGEERLKKVVGSQAFAWEAKGTKALKERMEIFWQAEFERLGGRKALESLAKHGFWEKGRDPYAFPSLRKPYELLKEWPRYVDLGGEEAYVRLNGPQGTEEGLVKRIKYLQDMKGVSKKK